MTAIFKAEAPKLRRIVLFVTPVTPAFSGNGLAMRAAHLIQALASLGFTIRLSILPIFDSKDTKLDEKVAEICQTCFLIPKPKFKFWNWLKRHLRIDKWRRPDLFPGERTDVFWTRSIERTLGPAEEDLLFVFRLYTLSFLSFRRLCVTPLWLDLDEIDSEAVSRQLKSDVMGEGYASHNTEVLKLHAYRKLEDRFLKLCSHLSISSGTERSRLPGDFKESALILPNIVRNREALPPRDSQAKSFRLLFVGSFGHSPNVDAVAYFCREIFGAIQEQREHRVDLTIVGADHYRKLVPFQGVEHIRILGWVDDLDPIYAETDLVIVPLRAGAGTRIKIIEAFSYGRCVVSTSVGAEGLDVKSGVELILADDPMEFANACAALLIDSARRQALAAGGHAYYRREHSPIALQRSMEAAWNSRKKGETQFANTVDG